MTYRLRNLLIALGLAGLAVALVSVYVTQYKHNVQSGENSYTVYVATRDIPAGMAGQDIVDRKMLKATTIERRNVVPGAIVSPSDIANTYTKEVIYAKEQVSLNRFGSSGAQGIRGQLTGTQRAIELKADPQNVLAGTLKTGDHVDVVATWTMPEGSQHHVSRVVLRDLLVLHAPEAGAVRSTIGSGPGGTAAVQLRLTDAQAHKLFFIEKNGTWSLVLRPPARSGDSPENLNDAQTIASEGMSAGVFAKASGGQQ